MKISVIVPALRNAGPILVAKDIIAQLVKQYPYVELSLFYFDKLTNPIQVDCATFWIKDTKNITKLYESHIIHTHGIRPDFYVFKNRKKIKGKCISTLHSLLSKEYSLQFNRLFALAIELFWTRILRRHDRIIMLTDVMMRHYCSFFSMNKLAVINNGRDINLAEIDANDVELFRRLKAKFKILGVACVLTKRKGLQQVIEIMPLLPDFTFVIIGDGPERINLEKQASRLNILNRCVFLGSRPEGSRYNKVFDYYVFPSYMEGLPLSLLEAAGVGKPIICSDIDIHREIFEHNEVSFFQLDDPKSLVRAIRQAELEHHELAEKVKHTYERKFTAKAMADSYYLHYQQLIDQDLNNG